jgi:hypothetical protein
VLLTRTPLYSPGCPGFLVRLACVKRAASVDSEPGSNSRLILLKQSSCFRGFLRFHRKADSLRFITQKSDVLIDLGFAQRHQTPVLRPNPFDLNPKIQILLLLRVQPDCQSSAQPTTRYRVAPVKPNGCPASKSRLIPRPPPGIPAWRHGFKTL